MSLRQKLYKVYLTNFKEEVCCDPGADFTPHIQKLAAEFGAREKSFVDGLFLDLYDGDAHSLKMDLCELKAPESAQKTELPKPISLLQCLYGKLSSHIEKDSSTIIAVCNQGVGIDQDYYETVLSKFKEEIRRNPDADFTPSIGQLADEIINWEKHHEERVVSVLFLNLYGQDTDSLDKDLIKLRVLKPAKRAAPPERIALLQLLCGALSSYIQE